MAFDKSILTKEEREFFEHRKLKDKFFIGCFNKTESGYLISDIRRSDFSKIKYKPKNSKSFTIEIDGSIKQKLKNDCYYKFTWVMLQSKPNYIFGVDEDEDIELIKPSEIVNLLYNDIYNYPASASEKIVNTLDTLKNQLTASGKEVFIYELLQNANDYPQKIAGKKQPVDVEFHITDNYLVFQHSGDYFDTKNIAAICSINDKEKTDNSEAIGYKGIGFKTVFLDNNYVLLKTGAYCFRFDYEQTKNIDDTPWQILPIWTDKDEVDEEVLDVMDNADKKFRVQIALRPTDADILHEREQNYEKLFADVFETERVILFIPFINSVSVYINDEEEPAIVKVKENDKWCVSEPKKYVSDVPEELTLELNRRINKNDGKIPEKYFDFKKTSVGFACKRDDNKLLPVENACLYCYLPAKKAKWGFGFLMNSDMIPTGPRDNVEPKEKINHVIAKIAGKQFFAWIQDLLNSQEFDYDSIFSLIPNFEDCKERYEEDKDVVKFIEEFQKGFEEELEEGAIIPVEEDGQMVLKPLDQVNYDETGITCSDLMTDDEVCEYTEWCDFFPHGDLRDYENHCLKPGIEAFMRTYVLDNYTLEFDHILETCENGAFQEWLTDTDNNNAFLGFLIEKGQIAEFKDKSIFMTEDEELQAASSIYEDIDEFYPDLVAFNDYLPRLAKTTRDYFVDDDGWENVHKDLFKSFDPDYFVNNELRARNNIEDTKDRLRDKQASLGFFKFLAEHVGYTSDYKVFPVIGFDDEVIDDFNENLYFYSKEGEELYNAEWTDEGWVNLISEDYSDVTKEYFKEKFEIPDFSIESFFENVILTKNAKAYLNDLGQEHIAFVKYCFDHKESLGENKLTKYALWAYDKDGENVQILSEDIIFFQDDLMDEYQGKVWIENGWMYRLDEEYYEDLDDMEAFKQFMSDVFGVLTFTMESFYENVVSPHVKAICDNVGGTQTDSDSDESIDILNYLGENYKLIFEDNGNEKFINLPLYRYDTWDAITDRDVCVYLYDSELEPLLDAKWMPEDVAYMLEERYNEVFSKYPQLVKKLEISRCSFKLYKESLLSDTDALAECTSEKEQNIAFHRFMFSNKDDLTKTDFKALNSIGIFAIDKDEDEELHSLDDALYLADIYMEAGKGVETMVKKYDETACFISDAYLSDDSEEEDDDIEAWRDYFVSLGARYNIRDIVFTSIVPNLADIKNKDIVSLLADYYDDFHAEDVWDDVKNDLCQLNVLTKSGEDDFRPIGDVLFNDCYDNEPYPYIVIEDEISDIYRNAAPEVMRLLREIANEAESDSFTSLDEWKKEKLEWYLYLQKEDFDSIEPIHTQFIQDLAHDYTLNSELYTRVKVREIKLKGKDGEYYSPKELTEGSVYKPRCDFERFELPLTYLSECYLPVDNPDVKVFRKLFTDMDVVYDIHEEHLTLMSDSYDFTIYFWTEYLIQYANRTHITSMGIEELNKYATIPTGNENRNEVKMPSQLYAQSLIQDGFVKGMVRGYEDKMPLESIFSTKEVKDEILGKLNFATTLSFCDCLDCLLHTKNKAKRQSILFWLANKNNIDEEAVDDYLNHEDSIWRNGRGVFVRLKDLYVIDIHEERLKQLFGKNAKVMSQEYIESDYIFNHFCEIFGIDALTQDDFELTPDIIDEPTTEVMRKKLRLPLLIVSAVSDSNNWKELYDDYCDKIDVLQFHRCNKIELNYQGELEDSSIQYHKDGAELFYVKDWMGRRVFKDFIENMVEYLDIDMDSNVLEGIFEADEDNQSEIIDHYVSYELSSDNDFMTTLKDLNADIAMGVEIVDRSDEEDLSDTSSEFGNSTQEEQNDEDYITQSVLPQELIPESEDFIQAKDINTQPTSKPSTQPPPSSSHQPSTKSTPQQGGTTSSPTSEQTDRKHAEDTVDKQSTAEKLKQEFEAKAARTVGRPTSSPKSYQTWEPPTSNIQNEVSPDPDLGMGTSSHDFGNSHSHRPFSSKVSKTIFDRNNNAQEQAEHAAEQVNLFELWQETEKYSYLWFKYLMKLQNSDHNEPTRRTVQIDFSSFKLGYNNKILHLSLPSALVPKWIEDASVKISAIGNVSRTIKGAIVKVDNMEIDILIDAEDISALGEAKKVRIHAESLTNIIDSLETRFLQLGYEDDYDMQANLPKDIHFVYGPPGTGKTTRLVEKLHDIVSKTEKDLSILVLTPTNKAADVISEKLIDDDVCYPCLTMFGATESKKIVEGYSVLETRDTIDLSLSPHNIVVTTAARYAYDFFQKDDIDICDKKWDYIVVDEASMMDLLTITYVLYKSKDATFIIAGDPKQIQPISDICTDNIYSLVGLDSFKDAMTEYNRYPVEALTVQHRSVPTIGNLVSHFAYDGLVQNDLQRPPQKPLILDGMSVREINFIGFKTEELGDTNSIYALTAVNKSAFHLYAAIFTYNMVEFMVKQITEKYPKSNYTIGIVCPYKAEANAIEQMLERKPLDSDVCKVYSGTVHRFQGDECDIMFVILNPPLNVSSEAHVNNVNIVNVAMSRARDYIFFIVPDSQIKGFYQRETLWDLADNERRTVQSCPKIEEVIFGDSKFIYKNTNLAPHLPVNVYYDNYALYEVRMDESTIDIEINDREYPIR